MSDQTKLALDAAIAAHIMDESAGALTTAYVLHVSYMSAENFTHESTGYLSEFAEHQPYHVGLGLAHQLVDEFANIWVDDDDDS